MGEYAKFVRIQANTLKARGFETLLTLPEKKSLGHHDDFINYYCGLGPFECGISTKPSSFFSGKWHWFVNSLQRSGEPINMKEPANFSDGQSIKFSLMIDEKDNNKIKFLVNNRPVYSSKNSYKGQNNARFIIACAQGTPDTERPLSPWGIFHSKVRVINMKYKNWFNIWREINEKNSSYTCWRLPEPILVPDSEFPNPKLYSISPLCDSSIEAWLES